MVIALKESVPSRQHAVGMRFHRTGEQGTTFLVLHILLLFWRIQI
jgi:hypothetical protein